MQWRCTALGGGGCRNSYLSSCIINFKKFYGDSYPLRHRRVGKIYFAAAQDESSANEHGNMDKTANQQGNSSQEVFQNDSLNRPEGKKEISSSIQGKVRKEDRYLYEPKYGLPVVRRKLTYSQLLRAIREETVDELLFYRQPEQGVLEGPCLIKFRDGTTAQSVVLPDDARLAYAMETHDVMGRLLPRIPSSSELYPPRQIGAEAAAFLVNVLPYLAVLGVWVATTIVKWRKGDAEDRVKIKQKEAEARKRKIEEDKVDRFLQDAEILAGLGWTIDEIMAKTEKADIKVDRDQIEEVVARAKSAPETSGPIYNTSAEQQLEDEKKFREKMKEKAAAEDPNAQAEEFRKMKTVKIQKAQDPERLRKLKSAQRQLKGVKLQYTEAAEAVFFEDVAGIGDAKVELQEVVDFFRKPERFRSSGAKIPKGVLLCGPPGTGKTLLARAVAGEAGVSFLSLNASEFVEMFVGVGASRVRDLFATARSIAPAIIFIDEIDSVGRIRGGAQGNDERDQTLNQMLSEMDGFSEDSGVIVMAATNRKDILDPALVRPGRFDRSVLVPLPDYNGRIEILQVHLAPRAHNPNIDLHEIAFETRQYSGAQLANLVNIAATIASADGREEIESEDLMAALESERLGPPRSNYNEPARKRLAYAEAATALTCTLLPSIEPVTVVTILPREKYPLGQTVVKANEGRELTQTFTKRYLEEQLITVLAGRAAEEVIYGPDGLTTIQQRRLVTARRIVTKLVVSTGMSAGETIGHRTLSETKYQGTRALLQIVPKSTPYEMQKAADDRMHELLEQGYQQSKELIQRNLEALEAIAALLMETNTITGDEVRELVEKHGSPEDLQRRAAERALYL